MTRTTTIYGHEATYGPAYLPVTGMTGPSPYGYVRVTAYFGFDIYEDGDGESGPHLAIGGVEEFDADIRADLAPRRPVDWWGSGYGAPTRVDAGPDGAALAAFLNSVLEGGYDEGGLLLGAEPRFGAYW